MKGVVTIYTVYMHVNKINGKKYVGITGQKPQRRWQNGYGYKTQKYFWRAIKKYTWNGFDHLILYKNMTKIQAREKQKQLIKKYNSSNPSYGYNITKGGDLSNIGTTYVYNATSGVYLGGYESTYEISQKFNIPDSHIRSVCSGKRRKSHGYYFSRQFLGNQLSNDLLIKINEQHYYDHSKVILQYTKNGKYLNHYNNGILASYAVVCRK